MRPAPPAMSRADLLRARHRWVLAMAAVALFGSLVLEVVPRGRVAVRGWEAYPLPHSCATRMLFDHGCPGCGLTRSFIHLAHGRWQQSLAMHRLGWLLAAAALLQFPYRTLALLGRNPQPLGNLVPQVFGYSLIGLLIGNWGYGLWV